MGRTLYAYADKLWEANRTFTYTGEAREFTIPPGEYLFICNGAAGGGTNVSRWWGYGATAYGVFSTNQEETLYAVVGGNGVGYAQGQPGTPTPGGFNGGGNGGYNIRGDDPGGSGGGASDIRLTMDDTPVPPVYQYNLPPEYEELEDIHLQWNELAYINTGYYPMPYDRFEMTLRVPSFSLERKVGWRLPFGTRTYVGTPDEQWMGIRVDTDMRSWSQIYGESVYTDEIFPCDEKVFLSMNSWKKRSSYLGLETGKTHEFIHTLSTTSVAAYPMFLFDCNNWGNAGGYITYGMRMYDFKAYRQDPDEITPDELIHHYVPAMRKSDNMYGVYDLIDQTFIGYTSYTGRMFGKHYDSPSRSLLSRILVAGGGGGDAEFVTYGFPICAFGGGKTAGFTVLKEHSDYSHTDVLPASQDEGYAFGKGEDGWEKSDGPSYGLEGAGGGGGGWFGGYTEAQFNSSYSSIGGSGGSSYALTADSWKPQGYIPTSHYHLTNTALVGCQTTEGSILICTEVKTLIPEDTIIVPFTGNSTKMSLYPGTYDVKCYGGEGGITYENGTSISRCRGGYSEGRLVLESKHDIYGVVGGSGLFRRGHTYSSKFAILNELASYNGGGDTVTNPYIQAQIPWNGGGATDLRLTMDPSPVHEPIPDPDTRDDIPSEYIQVKSVFMGDSYINSYYKPRANTTLKLDVMLTTNDGYYRELFGSDPYLNFYTVAMGQAAFVNNYDTIWGNTLPINTRLTIETTSNTLTWRSPNDSYTFASSANAVDCNVDLFFGTMNRSGPVDYVRAHWFSMKIYESNVLVRDIVPVIRKSDNQIGFYDVITDTFMACANSEYSYTPLSTVTFESKTLLSRFIVAGGAGGMGYNSSVPGQGGGTTGGTDQNGFGTNAGPGTQISSPQSQSYPTISGSFGQGGMGYSVNGGRGGAGGGGWFGGSGTYPNSHADDDRAGDGGSGYVLTEDSYKPEYYIPTEEFYLSNASTVLGGNTLPPNITKIEIDVVQAFCNKLLLHDYDGYKTYDEENETWIWFSHSISPELIDEYGRYDIPNINGIVSDDFEVVTDDPADVLSGIKVYNIPLPQSIVFLVPRRYPIDHSIIDAVYDTSIYDFSTNVSMYDNDYNAYTVTIDKTQESDNVLKLYSIMLFSK